jgi:hypothetical protein
VLPIWSGIAVVEARYEVFQILRADSSQKRWTLDRGDGRREELGGCGCLASRVPVSKGKENLRLAQPDLPSASAFTVIQRLKAILWGTSGDAQVRGGSRFKVNLEFGTSHSFSVTLPHTQHFRSTSHIR